MPATLNPDATSRLRRIFTGSAAALGVVALLGWAFGSSLLIRGAPEWTAMQPWTAVGLLLAGLSAIFAPARTAGALAVFAIGVLAICQYLIGTPAGTDTLLFPDAVTRQPHLSLPGRMAEMTAVEFCLFGAATLAGSRWPRLARLGATTGLIVAAIGLAGYLMGVEALAAFGTFVSMAVHTSLAFLLLFSAILLDQDGGWVRIFFFAGKAGAAARRIGLLAVAVPLVVGMAANAAGHWVRMPPSFAMAVAMVVVGGVMFAALHHVIAGVQEDQTELEARARALQESKERLRLFTEVVPATIAMFDRDMRYIAASHRFAEDFRVPLEGLIGRSHYEVFPEIPERWREIHRRCLAGATERCAEDPFPRQDGTLDWVAWELRPWYTAAGEVGGVVLGSEMITAHKRAEAALMKARAEAEQANQAKSRFLAAASHDLRQPVQSLILLLELLRTRSGDETLDRIVGQMGAATDALSLLLSGILDISRLDAGVVVPEITEVPLSEVFHRLGQEYRVRAEERGLRLRVPPSSLAVRTDPSLLERVLRNLIENALRYTEAGGVVVGAVRRGGLVRVDVVDSGIGIAETDIGPVFEEFCQINNPGRDRRLGLGLGLAIVQRTMRLLGGTIQVVSTPGRGSRFSVTFPRAERPSPPAGRPDAAPGRGQALLVVEDEPILRDSLGEMLQTWGYRVESAASGEAALGLVARGFRPAAVLADYTMDGGINGAETIRRLRETLGEGLPALILTGDTDPQHIGQLHASGITLLHKPATAADLRETLARCLG